MSGKNKSLVPKGDSAVAEFDPKSQREIVVKGLTDIERLGGDAEFPFDKEFWKNATLEEVEELIRKGADVNAKNEEGRTALMYAAEFNKNPEVIKVLLTNGADVNAKDKDGETALMSAVAFNKNPEVIQVLLNNGADMNAKDEIGRTALDFALVNNNEEIVELLERYGTDY